MKTKLLGDTLAIRLEIGDDVVESVICACRENNILCGTVSGIGACNYAKIGVFYPQTKAYEEIEFEGDMEICSLLGNMTEKEGDPYLHLHVTLSSHDGSVVGGHLKAATVSATGEIFVRKLTGAMGRKICDITGLNIFDI